jgi:leucyl-tRNA synthetase
MSKSKKNVVDPDEIISNWGADTARWFMLSDSPPDRDVIWTEAGVEGAHRFVQRIWRLVNEAAPLIAGATGPNVDSNLSAVALGLRRQVHKTLVAVEDDIERLSFNRAVARIYELVNAIFKVMNEGVADTDPSIVGVLSEAFDVLLQLIQPMMPHLAEESWSALGREGLLALTDWPVADRSLIMEDSVTMPVQINGKKRGELTVSRQMSEIDVQAAVLSLDIVAQALEGRAPKKIIIVPQRIVNVVA